MTAPAPAVATKDPVTPEVAVPTNPTLLLFPTDKWGFTSDVKKAVLKAASGVNAQDDKQALLVETLELLLAHVNARFPADATNKQNMDEQARMAYNERHTRRRHNWDATSG